MGTVVLGTSAMMKELGYIAILYLTVSPIMAIQPENDNPTEVTNNRDEKVLPVFQIVRFPNDPCAVVGGPKNGTCYTAEECSSKGGTNAGSCAQGFGVCCTFTLNCGGQSSENCTYFDSSTTVVNGACEVNICKCSTNICQIRLDFSNFVISGPSTSSTSVGLLLNGNLIAAGGGPVAEATQCLTDTFTITNQENLPVICGINSGYHVYFDASENCNSLNFQLGNVAQGLSSIATRSWSIKINQYACDYENLAPTGCDQWHFGSEATNNVQTFNYQSGRGVGRHLANQHQTICVRRESGMCRICWFAVTPADVGVSGETDGNGATGGTICCGHGEDGVAADDAAFGDCILIPGAQNNAGAVKPDQICGSMMGLNTDATITSTTICSTQFPFRIEFQSDAFEFSDGATATNEGTGGNPGFKVRYFQES